MSYILHYADPLKSNLRTSFENKRDEDMQSARWYKQDEWGDRPPARNCLKIFKNVSWLITKIVLKIKIKVTFMLYDTHIN